jgi:hypothetical protein
MQFRDLDDDEFLYKEKTAARRTKRGKRPSPNTRSPVRIGAGSGTKASLAAEMNEGWADVGIGRQGNSTASGRCE